MTTTQAPICFDCRHFIGEDEDQDGTFLCKAYQKEIPDAILVGHHDHRNPYPGDNGIRFEPIKEEE